MKRNSTLILWNYLIDGKHNFLYSDKELKGFKPDQKVVDKIMAYAKSVHSVKTNSGKRILINLN